MIINGEELQSDKTYPSIPVDKEIVQMISKAGVELPVELVNGFEEIYKEYQTILAGIKQKADSQTTEARTARFMKFHDQYQDSFDNMSTASKLDMLQILAT
jgi:hypothetical protein